MLRTFFYTGWPGLLDYTSFFLPFCLSLLTYNNFHDIFLAENLPLRLVLRKSYTGTKNNDKKMIFSSIIGTHSTVGSPWVNVSYF